MLPVVAVPYRNLLACPEVERGIDERPVFPLSRWLVQQTHLVAVQCSSPHPTHLTRWYLPASKGERELVGEPLVISGSHHEEQQADMSTSTV